jgi:hypothetical protein
MPSYRDEIVEVRMDILVMPLSFADSPTNGFYQLVKL